MDPVRPRQDPADRRFSGEAPAPARQPRGAGCRRPNGETLAANPKQRRESWGKVPIAAPQSRRVAIEAPGPEASDAA
jgi:hypothetical protein